MAVEITYDDFDDRLRRIEGAAFEGLQRSITQLLARNAAKGMLNSGSTVKGVLDLFDQSVVRMTDDYITALQLFMAKSSLDAERLRSTINVALTSSFKLLDAHALNRLKSLADSPSVAAVVNDRIKAQWDGVRYKLRQLDIGLVENPMKQTDTRTVNTIHAQTIIGGVQQGTVQSTQVSNSTVDTLAIQQAVQWAEAALADCAQGPDRAEIEGDLATIKAQLQKSTPSPSILKEAGKSLRNLTEGVAAGLLTPSAVSALMTLATALGVG